MKHTILIALLLFTICSLGLGQVTSSSGEEQSEKTLVEKLGYPPDAKLLIIHADDLGVAHSVNAASIKALEKGLVNSASLMVPCPWFAEIAAYARSHPEADLGVHLTLTNEWKFYRWGPVLSGDRVKTLLDPEGYFYRTGGEVTGHSDIGEVEAEIRSQISRAKAFGVQPTHLDSHMGVLFQNKVLLEVLLRVGRDNGLPVMISREWFDRHHYLPSLLGPNDIVLNKIIIINPKVPTEEWEEFYVKAIESIQPGITEIIVHLAYDDEEMRAVTINHPDWGAKWRQRDFNFFTSEKLRQLLKENDIKLITWRELGKTVTRPEK